MGNKIFTFDKWRGMRSFFVLWIGQTLSITGTRMTNFALSIWIFSLTNQATSLVLVNLAYGIPRILVLFLSGLLVDRVNRKAIIILSDLFAGFVTVWLIYLLKSDRLTVMHIYWGALLVGPFDAMQSLAYTTSTTMLVSKEQFLRANSLTWLTEYGTNITSPALAAVLYNSYGLIGVLVVDLLSFLVAMIITSLVKFPNLIPTPLKKTSVLDEIALGFRLLLTHHVFRTFLIFEVCFVFFHDMSFGLYEPMILALSDNNTSILATVVMASGIGGILASLIMGWWGGPKRKIITYLFGTVSAGVSKILFSLCRGVFCWTTIQFYASSNFPIRGSSYNAIWRTKTEPNVQGRIFSVISILTLSIGSLAQILAAALGDLVFEPNLMTKGSWLCNNFCWAVGTSAGSGYSLIFLFAGIGMTIVGISGYFLNPVRNIEELIPDFDSA